MSNNLALRVTADVTDAQAKLSVLNAEFRATQTQINSLARAGAAGNLDTAGAAELQAFTARSLELQAAARPLAVSIKDAGFALSGLGAASLHAGEEVGHSASAVRYLRETFDEVSSGRTRYLPSTLAAFAQQALHMNMATLASVGGVAALAAGLGYLAYRAVEAGHALDQIHLNSLMAGNDVTRDQLGQLTDQIAQLPHVGASAAQQLVTSLSTVHMPFDALQASVRLAAETMEATGQKANEVGKEIAKALNPDATATEVAKQYQNDLTQAQVDAAEAADKTGNANAILAEKLQLLEAPLARARAQWEEYAHSSVARVSEVMGAAEHLGEMGRLGGMGQTMPQIEAQTDPLRQEAQQWQSNAAAIRQYTAAVAELPAEKRLVFKTKVVDRTASHGQSLTDQVGNELLTHQQEIANQLPALMRQAQQQQNAIEQAGAESSQNILQMRVEYARNALDAQVAAGKMSAEQRAAVERALTQTLYQEDLQRLENERASLDGQPAEYARVTNEITQLKMREALELQQIGLQEAADAKSAAQKQLEAYEKALAPISNAISTSLNGVIMGTQTLQASVAHALDSVVEKFISAGVKATVNWAAQEAQKTAATIAGEQTRTAAAMSGNAARTASTASAAAAQKGMSAAAGASTVQADAAKAYSGTYASVAQIPYVGWIMAPIAASGAYAAVMAYEGLASLDVGTFDVPRDMVAQIHAHEMVVPRSFADGVRSMMSGGGSAGGGSGGDTHISHYGDINIANDDVRAMLSSPQARDEVVRTISEAIARGHRL